MHAWVRVCELLELPSRVVFHVALLHVGAACWLTNFVFLICHRVFMGAAHLPPYAYTTDSLTCCVRVFLSTDERDIVDETLDYFKVSLRFVVCSVVPFLDVVVLPTTAPTSLVAPQPVAMQIRRSSQTESSLRIVQIARPLTCFLLVLCWLSLSLLSLPHVLLVFPFFVGERLVPQF
jgi:hypothetical protein